MAWRARTITNRQLRYQLWKNDGCKGMYIKVAYADANNLNETQSKTWYVLEHRTKISVDIYRMQK
jgi:hypothetical protein